MSTLRAGIARRDITPPAGTELFGYPTQRFGNDVADALNATALVLSSDETSACLISLDWCLLDEDETTAIRREIEAATGIAAQNITLCATHTHSGPVTIECWGWGEKNQEYLDNIRPRIVEAVVAAQSTLQSVRAGCGVTSTDTGINRRVLGLDGTAKFGPNEWGPRDRDLTVVRFEGENGPVASLIHLSAHPTARGSEPSIARDWPGVMIDRVEKITDAPVLFINGAFGDVAPRMAVEGASGDGEIAALETGLRAAYDAICAWRKIKQFQDWPLQTFAGQIELPLAPLPSKEEAERESEASVEAKNQRGRPGCEWHYWNAVLEAQENPPQDSRVFNQTITKLGPIAIVPFAGEVFSEIALRLKEASPFPHTLVAGTSNGSHGYYVTREGYERGGYEPWVGKAYSAYLLAKGMDDVLVRENLVLLKLLADL